MKTGLSRTRLGRNLTVVSEHLSSVRSVSLGFWIDRGARDETPETMGLSHLYEHMIFKGTPGRSAEEIARVLEKSGGSLNAFTSKEQVCIHARFVDEELATACGLITDIFGNSLYDAAELAKEKNVVLEEIRGSDDNPEEFVHDAVMECLWPEDSLGYSITGRAKNVKRFGRDHLLAMNKKMLGSRLVVAASGNLRHDRLCGYFKGLSRTAAFEPVKRQGAGQGRPLRRFYPRKIQQANVCLGFKCSSFFSDDKYPFFILNAMLGDGMSSRLFQNVRERLGLCYSVYSFLDAFADTGILGVYLGTDPADLSKALGAVFAEIKGVAEGKVTDEELDFAKSYIRGNVLLGMENTGNRMGQLAKCELYLGRPEPVEKTLRKIEAVTKDDLRRVGRRYFNDRALALAVAAPSLPGIRKEIDKRRW